MKSAEEIASSAARYFDAEDDTEFTFNLTRDITAALRAYGNERVEAVAVRCKEHGDFCRKEAMSGGAVSLHERASGAFYLESQARALIEKDGA